MRKFLLCCLTIFAFNKSEAQQPEPILSFATQLKPVSWYSEQAKLWKAEVDQNNSNAYAWFNYYRAMRNKVRLDTTDKRDHKLKLEEMKTIINKMSQAVPNTFEYNLAKWMFEGNNLEYLSNLKKAAELGPERIEICSDMMGWGEISRDIPKRDRYAKLWFDKGPVSPGLMYYNYNVLMGLKPNALLITTGDNDTYPCWILQSLGIRRDVTVINTSLIHIDEYRNALFKELGIGAWKGENEFKDDSLKRKAYARYEKELVTHLAENTKNHSVYIALTCSEAYTIPIEKSLYLTGLAYEYSLDAPDNIAVLQKNFEQIYALDYIDKPFYFDISSHYSQLSNCNYVVPMIKLYDHYILSGEKSKAMKMKERVLYIVKGRSEEADTRKYFEEKPID